VKRGKRSRRVKVSADGHGVVSHAGVGLLREMAEDTGLVDGLDEALIDTYKGLPWRPTSRSSRRQYWSRTRMPLLEPLL
jgi:hypothetical protein